MGQISIDDALRLFPFDSCSLVTTKAVDRADPILQSEGSE